MMTHTILDIQFRTRKYLIAHNKFQNRNKIQENYNFIAGVDEGTVGTNNNFDGVGGNDMNTVDSRTNDGKESVENGDEDGSKREDDARNIDNDGIDFHNNPYNLDKNPPIALDNGADDKTREQATIYIEAEASNIMDLIEIDASMDTKYDKKIRSHSMRPRKYDPIHIYILLQEKINKEYINQNTMGISTP